MASKPTRNRASAAGRSVPAAPKPARTPHRPAADPAPDPVDDTFTPPLRTVLPSATPPATIPPAPPEPACEPDTPAPGTALDANGFDPGAYDWVPVARARRVDGWGPERQRSFIGHLADTGSVRTAATLAGMSPSSAYRLRRAPEGKAFAAAWDAAIHQAALALVDAAFERAVHGSEEPVFCREGRVIGRRFRQSDAMMMFLLRKHLPDRYGDLHRDRAMPAISATAPVPIAVDDALARLGPVPPADPAATLDPGRLELYIARADNGKLPADLQNADDAPHEGLGPQFEAELELAKRGLTAEQGEDDPDSEEADFDDDDDDGFDLDQWAEILGYYPCVSENEDDEGEGPD
ncbi:hypothetical protein H5J25_18395 [Sphingomonas aliaeris]|uniref:Uncharacterized protein n=1 Tax=Sphingomonas aliaeris TaxID=2759526 RepID=A0A974NUZ9_9SPHN|nr:hypothetical protein [Sphingomonas aliaeris]QQV77250.1 hypothetical protein H5J25_18395 [Sphingomonas aliaeris]